MILHGKDLLILNSSGTALIAGARSCEIDIQQDMVEKASPTSGKAKTFKPGRSEWSVNVSYLVSAPLTDIESIGDTEVTLRVKVRGENTYLQGAAYFQHCHITASVGYLAQGSFVLKGSGPLSRPTS